MSKQQQRGSIIIIAVLIIAAVLASASVISSVIIRSIQQSRLIDHSIRALYQAEAGAERALYQTRKREAIKPVDCPAVTGNPGAQCDSQTGFCSGGTVPCIATSAGASQQSLVGGWQTQVSEEDQLTLALAPGEAFQLDLFNPYQSIDNFNSNLRAILIHKNPPTDFTLYSQLANVAWSIGGTLSCPAPTDPLILPVVNEFRFGSAGDETILGLVGTSMNFNCPYTFRLTVPFNVSDGAGNYTISLFSDPNLTNQISIPSRLRLRSQAQYGDSIQTVTVHTPMRPPVSGLYDFVLFSAQEIIK